MFNMSSELSKVQNYLSKCRCCLQGPGDNMTFTKINKSIAETFLRITNVKLTISPSLSCNICTVCHSEIIKISAFLETLVSNQNFLYELISNFETSEKEKNENFSNLNEDESNFIKLETDFTSDSNLFENSEPKRNSQKNFDMKGNIKKKQIKTTIGYPDNTCPECGKKFTEKRKIPLHIRRVHIKIKDFHCDLCDYSSYTRFDIVRHVRNVHTPSAESSGDHRVCPHCGKVVRGNNQLTLHIRKKHLNIKKYQCDMCSFASYLKYAMRSHLEHVHIPKEFKEFHQCNLCPSVLSSAIGLKVHMQHKHSGLKPHSCFCGKSFSLRETLKTHIRNVHKGERRFVCQLCPKRFGQAVRLKDHMNNAHGTKQEIPCTLCSKIFHSSRNLKAHLVYHDVPKFNCEQCGKKFYLSNKLKEHLKTHDGTLHICNLCSRSFQIESSLKRHLKNHIEMI